MKITKAITKNKKKYDMIKGKLKKAIVKLD